MQGASGGELGLGDDDAPKWRRAGQGGGEGRAEQSGAERRRKVEQESKKEEEEKGWEKADRRGRKQA